MLSYVLGDTLNAWPYFTTQCRITTLLKERSRFDQFLRMMCTSVATLSFIYRRLCLWFAGTSSQGHRFDLQMAQAGFSSHLVKVSTVCCLGEQTR